MRHRLSDIFLYLVYDLILVTLLRSHSLPKYEALAKSFKDSAIDSVIIAKMDATANEIDHPEIDIKGYPTIKFFPAKSNGKVVSYDGALEADSILKFVHANAGNKFKKPKYKAEL